MKSKKQYLQEKKQKNKRNEKNKLRRKEKEANSVADIFKTAMNSEFPLEEFQKGMLEKSHNKGMHSRVKSKFRID